MKKLFGIGIVVGLLAVGGCKKKEDGKAQQGSGQAAAAAGGKAIGGCDRREKEHVCGEYHGAAKLEWIKEECKTRGAPFVESCPKEGAAGRCASEVGTPMETHTLYYAPMTKETVTAMCKPPMQLREP